MLSATASPQKRGGQRVIRQRSAEPLPPPPPPKSIDLNSSTRSTDKDTGAKVTRRAFLCDVVVERLGEETANLLAYLGQPLKPLSTLPPPPPATNGRPTTPSRLALPPDSEDDEGEGSTPGWTGPRRQEMSVRLINLIEELVRTERSYLSRVHALKTSYADRLRLFARDPNQQLIPPYEAKSMFANIEAIVPASAAFLTDLDAMLQSGRGEEQVGDICLRHFKELRTFDPYRTYLSKQDESQKLFQDSLKRFPGFASFIDSTKYQTTGIGNIGLRELLMEPVQRIPRYTLLWQTMIKCMSPLSTQRAKLLEATEIASRIARCEPDPQTIRATVMYNLERNIEDFPAKLFSNNRDYIDSIDVEDLPAEYPTASSPPSSRPLSTVSSRPMSLSSSSTPSMNSFGSMTSTSHLAQSPPAAHPAMSTLHCTLFLFDDKLVIVKRQSSSISGRKVTGTDDVQKLVKTGGGVAIMNKDGAKKDKLSFRGEVDILEVIASDVGNGDFHLFFERPPMDQSGRWSARPFRSYSTVHPPYAMSMDPIATKRDKLRFVQNLWAAQALARAKQGPGATRPPPRILMSEEELSLAEAGEPFGRAKCFYDVWDRESWTNQRKAKVVIHIDEEGDAPDLPMQASAPVLMLRLQPVEGGLCRMSYTTSGDEDDDRMVVDMAEINSKIATTIHRYGIFKFRTGTTSCPTTPSAQSHRLRPSMLNLDAISRNLFGAASVSGRSAASSDIFSTSSSKRASKPPMSRSSTMETTLLSIESAEHGADRAVIRRSASPSEPDDLVAGAPYIPTSDHMGQSEIDLNERLNMAQKNSKSVATISSPPSRLGAKSVAELRGRVEEKEAAAEQADAAFRSPLPSSTPLSPTAPLRVRNKTPSPTRALSPSSEHTPRAFATPASPGTLPLQVRRPSTLSQSILPDDTTLFTSPRAMAAPGPSTAPLSPRPTGPRSPPPGPRSPPPRPITQVAGLGLGSAHTKLRIVSGGGRKISLGRETIPLKGDDENDSSSTSTPSTFVTSKRQHSADQLSPRKRSPPKSPLHLREVSDPSQIMPDPPKVPSLSKKPGSRRSSGRHTPRRPSAPLTPRTVSASQTSVTSIATGSTVDDVDMSEHENINLAMDSARKKIRDARGSTKRLKSEMAGLRKQMTKSTKGGDLAGRLDRAPSLPRSPQRRNMNRLTDSDAMYDPISTRATSGKSEIDAIVMDECARGIVSIAERIDGHLRQAEADSEQALTLARSMQAESEQKSQEITALQAQVYRSKEQRELLQRQLGDAQIELDVIYEAFNTELDGMFNDAQLPETEAFEALKTDLRATKAKRNTLELENQKLKRQLEEANLKREQWARMLRAQGYEV